MFLRFLIFVLFLNVMIIVGQTPPIEPGVSQALAIWRGANYSDVRYKLNIKLEKGAPLMKGTIEISVNLTDEGAKNDLILDWRTTQFANDKDKPFADVVSVNTTVMGKATQSNTYDYQTTKEHLLISHRFFKTGENTIKINFASPIKTSGAAITRYVDKEDGAEYVYSLFVPSDASTAFPVFDQPDLKARFTLGISVPKDWKVVKNSNSISPSRTYTLNHTAWRDGFPVILSNKISYFEETKPISTYVFAFAAGDFAEFEDESEIDKSDKKERAKLTEQGKIVDPSFSKILEKSSTVQSKIYVRKSQAEKFKQHAAEVFRLNREGVRFLENYFDYKFPFPKYDLVLIPEFPFGGMEHAGATFLREDRVIFPTEPTKNDYITRANVIFHEAAHQWFGDTVTMKWFDDLWLKEGLAEFMAYKTLEKVMPEYNAWKIFYERNKQAAYLTDSTRGTTPIYQEIPNLSAAKSAYGNIVYRKAPSFLKQAEFLLGEDNFQTAVRSFLKKHEFKNAEWTDLVNEFEIATNYNLKNWANGWVKQRGVPIIKLGEKSISQKDSLNENSLWTQKFKIYQFEKNPNPEYKDFVFIDIFTIGKQSYPYDISEKKNFIFPNYQDYGYGIFLLDEKSRAYILANIQTEKDDFLRTMMWGALWDSVREGELNPKDYVELVIKNINVETDESTIQTILSRVSIAMNYYLSEPSAVADGLTSPSRNASSKSKVSDSKLQPSATADGSDLLRRLEDLLIDKMQNAPTLGTRITYYRAFLNIASSDKARMIFKEIYNNDFGFGGGDTKMRAGVKEVNGKMIYAANPAIPMKTKDRFDIITKLLILGDVSAPKMLAELEQRETSDEAKRYAYAAKAGIETAENKAKFWNDFTNNKELSESYIESAFVPFNSPRHADLTLPYLEKALAELPNLKKNRKIFFVNGWLSAFIGGQKSEQALAIVNKFLADNPNLDKDLRLKILENTDGLERAVKIRAKYGR